MGEINLDAEGKLLKCFQVKQYAVINMCLSLSLKFRCEASAKMFKYFVYFIYFMRSLSLTLFPQFLTIFHISHFSFTRAAPRKFKSNDEN